MSKAIDKKIEHWLNGNLSYEQIFESEVDCLGNIKFEDIAREYTYQKTITETDDKKEYLCIKEGIYYVIIVVPYKNRMVVYELA